MSYIYSPGSIGGGYAYIPDAPAPSAADKKASEDKEYNDFLNQEQQGRQQDLAQGKKEGEAMFGDGSLGRLDANRSPEMSDIINQRKAYLNGYTPEEMGAMRDQFTTQGDTQLQTGLRQLAGAAGRRGLTGSAAQGQATRLVMDSGRTAAQNEQALFSKNVDLKRQALSDYSGAVKGAEDTETQKQQFNLGQSEKEKLGQLGTEFGYAGLGAGERATALNRVLGDKQADATVQAAQSGSKK